VGSGWCGAKFSPKGRVQTLVPILVHRQQPQAACDAPRWRFNVGRQINVEATMAAATVARLGERGHQAEGIAANSQDLRSGQFIWRLGDPAVEGYVAASDSRRDGLAA